MDDFSERQARVVALTLMVCGLRDVTITAADLTRMGNLFDYKASVAADGRSISVALMEKRAKGQKQLPIPGHEGETTPEHSGYGGEGKLGVRPVVAPKPKVHKGKRP